MYITYGFGFYIHEFIPYTTYVELFSTLLYKYLHMYEVVCEIKKRMICIICDVE